MKVNESMTKNPVTVESSATAKEVAEKMKEENIGTVLVTDKGRLKATAKEVAEKMKEENIGTVLVTDKGRLKVGYES